MDVKKKIIKDEDIPIRTSEFELIKQVLVNQEYMLAMIFALGTDSKLDTKKQLLQLYKNQKHSREAWQKKQQATEMLKNLEDEQ